MVVAAEQPSYGPNESTPHSVNDMTTVPRESIAFGQAPVAPLNKVSENDHLVPPQAEFKRFHLRRDSIFFESGPVGRGMTQEPPHVVPSLDKSVAAVKITRTSGPQSIPLLSPPVKSSVRVNTVDEELRSDGPTRRIAIRPRLLKILKSRSAPRITLQIPYQVCRAVVLARLRDLHVRVGDAGCGILVCEYGREQEAEHVSFSFMFAAGDLPRSRFGGKEAWLTKVTSEKRRGSRVKYRELVEDVMKRLREAM